MKSDWTTDCVPSDYINIGHWDAGLSIWAPVPFGRMFFRLFTIAINSAIANNLKPIEMMKMQCETIYPNSYERVSDYMKIHHVLLWTFYGHFANKASWLRIDKTKREQFPRNAQIFQNIIWMVGLPISFRQKWLPCRSVSDSSRLPNCLYRKQSEKYSAKWDRGFTLIQRVVNIVSL